MESSSSSELSEESSYLVIASEDQETDDWSALGLNPYADAEELEEDEEKDDKEAEELDDDEWWENVSKLDSEEDTKWYCLLMCSISLRISTYVGLWAG